MNESERKTVLNVTHHDRPTCTRITGGGIRHVIHVLGVVMSCIPWAVTAVFLFHCQASAQVLPAIGTESTFDVVTWNIEWFGEASQDPPDVSQFENVRRVISTSDADLWALQEIADVSDFDALIDALGEEYSGTFAFQGSDLLRTAFIYRNDRVFIRDQGAIRHILTDQTSQSAFAGRPPLLMEIAVRGPGGAFHDVVVISLHMKANADYVSYTRRRDASRLLKGYLDVFFPESEVIVLGDFNDKLTGSITPGEVSPFQNFLFSPGSYKFASSGMGSDSEGTWCPNLQCTGGSVIDHILITNELIGRLQENTAFRYSEVLNTIPAYVRSTSDHLPVYARFTFETQTAGHSESVEAASSLGSPHPNPANNRIRIPVTIAGPAMARFSVYDVLGVRRYERVVSSNGREQILEIDCARWPSGLYLVRLETDGWDQSRHLTISR